eukprot:5619895-Prymnesium_polylepis.1
MTLDRPPPHLSLWGSPSKTPVLNHHSGTAPRSTPPVWTHETYCKLRESAAMHYFRRARFARA